MGLKVFSECCQNCLLSKNRIVSSERAKEIIKTCKEKQQYFICHKASIKNEDIVCSKFFKDFGGFSQMIRIAERLNAVEFVPQTDNEKLPPFKK
jgi:hypothetical protein